MAEHQEQLPSNDVVLDWFVKNDPGKIGIAQQFGEMFSMAFSENHLTNAQFKGSTKHCKLKYGS